MRNFSKLGILMVLSLILFTTVLSSCKSKNDPVNLLLGTWYTSAYGGRLLEIGNNTWIETINYDNSYRSSTSGTYSYDSSSRTIIINYKGNNGSYYTGTYYVQSVTSESLALIRLWSDGTTDSYLYTRKK